MLTNPILADKHPRLAAWIRGFSAAGFGPRTIAHYFRLDLHDVQLIIKETT